MKIFFLDPIFWKELYKVLKNLELGTYSFEFYFYLCPKKYSNLKNLYNNLYDFNNSPKKLS